MSIIKNFGFYWKRDYIYRGKGRAAGHLLGQAAGGSRADFQEQIGVYVLYGSNREIVYVGQAGNGNATLFGRLKNHMDGRLRNRWSYFTWFGFRDVNADGSLSRQQAVDSAVSGFTYSEALNQLEGILIEVIEPPLNKRRGNLREATEFNQVIDEKVADITPQNLMEEIKLLHKQFRDLKQN